MTNGNSDTAQTGDFTALSTLSPEVYADEQAVGQWIGTMTEHARTEVEAAGRQLGYMRVELTWETTS